MRTPKQPAVIGQPSHVTREMRVYIIEKAPAKGRIAHLINKSQQGYNHIEKRRARLSIEDFMTLCEFYNLSPEYFLGYTKEMKPLK